MTSETLKPSFSILFTMFTFIVRIVQTRANGGNENENKRMIVNCVPNTPTKILVKRYAEHAIVCFLVCLGMCIGASFAYARSFFIILLIVHRLNAILSLFFRVPHFPNFDGRVCFQFIQTIWPGTQPHATLNKLKRI